MPALFESAGRRMKIAMRIFRICEKLINGDDRWSSLGIL